MPLHLILPTYIVAWWITLLFVLPIGVQQPLQRDAVHYAGAPVNVRLLRKLCWNTLLAGAVTVGIHLLCLSGLMPGRSGS